MSKTKLLETRIEELCTENSALRSKIEELTRAQLVTQSKPAAPAAPLSRKDIAAAAKALAIKTKKLVTVNWATGELTVA